MLAPWSLDLTTKGKKMNCKEFKLIADTLQECLALAPTDHDRRVINGVVDRFAARLRKSCFGFETKKFMEGVGSKPQDTLREEAFLSAGVWDAMHGRLFAAPGWFYDRIIYSRGFRAGVEDRVRPQG